MVGTSNQSVPDMAIDIRKPQHIKNSKKKHLEVNWTAALWGPQITKAVFPMILNELPSGKHTKNYGKSPFLMGQLTINDHFQ